MYIYDSYNFKYLYDIDESVMGKFLDTVESSYRVTTGTANFQKNPYHNSTHAADVMHAVHYFLSVLGLNELVTPEVIFMI